MAETILIASHYAGLRTTFQAMADSRGYSATVVGCPRQLAPELERDFDLYLIELNLGSPASTIIDPAQEAYESLSARINSGQARFLGFSSTQRTIKLARERGIPCALSSDIGEIVRFLDNKTPIPV